MPIFKYKEIIKVMTNQIKNGDIFNIGQTINGVSKFIYLNDIWYYFSPQLFIEYEYSQSDLTDLIKNDEFDEVKYIGNIYSLMDKK